MLEGKKNNLQAHTRKKKNFIVNQGVEKKIHDQTKSPPSPPSEVKWSAPKLSQFHKPYCHVILAPRNSLSLF